MPASPVSGHKARFIAPGGGQQDIVCSNLQQRRHRISGRTPPMCRSPYDPKVFFKSLRDEERLSGVLQSAGIANWQLSHKHFDNMDLWKNVAL